MSDQVIPASGSDTTGDVSAYCVIGPSATQTFDRTWKKTQAAAAAHARSIIRRSTENGRSKVQKLFVVQVVEVLEVAGPPILSRGLEVDDTAGE